MDERRRRLGLAAAAVGLLLLCAGGYEAAGLRVRLLPSHLLIGARSIAVLDDGRVFVGSDLSHVHVYSSEGQPLYGFSVPEARFRLEAAGPDRLRLEPEDGSARWIDAEGRPANPPHEPASDAAERFRVEGGDVVRVDGASERVFVRGYASHAWMLAHILGVGVLLFAGGLLLVGGVVATGRRLS